MPLNYSKWDRLEVSDDSDIEGHPNVDHKSLVRWKQRDIHEKREQRNHRIVQLNAEIACNDVLLPRLRTILEDVHAADDGPQQYSRTVEKLEKDPSPDAPATQAANPVTYDAMILNLLHQISKEAQDKGLDKNDDRLREFLIQGLKTHVAKLGEELEKLKKELTELEQERSKKITSEDIHEGWDSKYVPPKPDPAPVKGSRPATKSTETSYEVINEPKDLPSGASGSGPTGDEADELPEMTPNLTAFSKIPLRNYDASFRFIQEHRDVYVPSASDALLVAAFSAQSDGKPTYAKQCVHQSLLLQYCEKLGRDGVNVFFKRMMSGDPRAEGVFLKDVEDTYTHLAQRVQAAKEEEAASAGVEQIQLVPEKPGQTISFNVPDGPPPEDFTLEGEGLENVDKEEVRKALEMRWVVFQGFPKALQEALKTQRLEEVNKVLGDMKVEEAEGVVGLLDSAGILNFAEGGIRDETGRHKEDDDGDADAEDEDEGEDDDATEDAD